MNIPKDFPKEWSEHLEDLFYKAIVTARQTDSNLWGSINHKIEQHGVTLDAIRLEIAEKLGDARKESDKRYAIKLAETLIFGLCSLVLVGAVGSIIKLILVP